jgi:predicted dehydrogenase
MKKIGFIDYYLDEWHALNYPKWIKESSFKDKFEVRYAWAEKDKEGGLTSAQWCAAHKVELTGSKVELIEKSDCIVVLAPDNPERHADLCREVLAAGKPVYVDKTFAPDLATAKKLFAWTEKSKTPMFSSSALRFAAEIAELRANREITRENTKFVATRGPGEFDNYGIHQVEMIVVLMGIGAKRLIHCGIAGTPVIIIDYDENRRAMLSLIPDHPFQISLCYGENKGVSIPTVQRVFFQRFIEELLRFFDGGAPAAAQEETLEIMAILEAGKQVLQMPDKWMMIPR